MIKVIAFHYYPRHRGHDFERLEFETEKEVNKFILKRALEIDYTGLFLENDRKVIAYGYAHDIIFRMIGGNYNSKSIDF